MSLETLPDIQVVGPLRDDEELVAQVQEHFRDSATYSDVEKPHDPEFDAGLDGIFEATTAYLRNELGLDPSNRMPGRRNVHILTRDDMYEQFPTFQEDDMKKLDIYGMAVGGYDMVIRELQDRQELPRALHVVQHELLHVLSRSSYGTKTSMVSETERSVQLRPHKIGLMVVRKETSPFAALNEHVTERTAHEIAAKYWGSSVLPEGMSRMTEQGHQVAVETGNAILARVSRSTGRSEEDIFRGWQREYFMGGSVEMRAVADEIGHDAMKRLVLLPAQDADQVLAT